METAEGTRYGYGATDLKMQVAKIDTKNDPV